MVFQPDPNRTFGLSDQTPYLSLRGSSCKKLRGVEILKGREDLNRGSEYIEELHRGDRGPPPHTANKDGHTIMEDEVRHTLSKMKNGELPYLMISRLNS
ncbi:hypothetical protein PoB_001654400 [Plakobranchus ocellatus]|uniref:Uncharacterized protein n=1 Tax=Plakobranchus ocellatus TaxID=259542 RepID=A0AAV3Z7R5_9GAST|nr:hypothetical protein PoB_001654400 [Plakobranchus ocellatus]